MKKVLYLWVATLCLLFACQREEGEVVFEATLASEHAKVAMGPLGQLSWDEGDLVRLGYFGNSTVFEVALDNHNQVAHLHQKSEVNEKHTYRNSTEFFALCPGSESLSINNTITGDTTLNKSYKVTSLGSQQLVTNSRHYDKDWLVCTAAHKVSRSDIPASGTRTVRLEFHNCMALLKCTIDQGCTNIYQLKVSADNAGAYLGGHAWASACDAGVNLATTPRPNHGISDEHKKWTVVLKHKDNVALEPGDYYIAIWSDYYNETNVTSSPSSNTADYAKHTTKKNVTIRPCDANGNAITSYGSYTVGEYSFFRNTIYPVGTFPKTGNTSSKEPSIFH